MRLGFQKGLPGAFQVSLLGLQVLPLLLQIVQLLPQRFCLLFQPLKLLDIPLPGSHQIVQFLLQSLQQCFVQDFFFLGLIQCLLSQSYCGIGVRNHLFRNADCRIHAVYQQLHLHNTRIQLLQAGGQLGKSVLHLGKVILYSFLVFFQLLSGLGKLPGNRLLLGIQLLLTILQVLFVLLQKLQSLLELNGTVIQQFLVVLQLLLPFQQGILCIQERLLCLLFAFVVGLQAVLILGKALVVFLPAIGKEAFIPFLGQNLYLGFYLLRKVIHCLIVFICVGFVVPGHGDIYPGIVVHVKGIPGYVDIGSHRAVSQGGVIPVHVHKQRRGNIAYNGEGLVVEAFQRFRLVGVCNPELVVQGSSVLEVGICQTFVGGLRHPAFQKIYLIYLLGDGINLVNCLGLGISHRTDDIHIDGPFHIHHLGKLFYRLRLLQAPAIVIEQGQVVHILSVHIIPGCFHHGNLAGQQSHKQAGTQCNNRHNGNIPAHGFPYGTPQVSSHHVLFHYHSISEILCGCSFRVSDTTVPFFTRITRSAMAVKALLWVMMMMVIPVFLPVSCKSCKMALPVW